MACRIATQEDYDLWTLGTLDGPLAGEITAHLRNGCPVCIHAVRQGASFWAAMAYGEATASPANPSSNLRIRVLANTSVTRRRSWWSRPLERRWLIPVFAAANLILAVVVLSRPGHRAGTAADPHTAEIARLQNQLAEMRQRAEARPQQPAVSAPPPAPPANPQAANPNPNPALEKQLAEARDQAAALAAERARVSQLQSELDSVRALASRAVAQKEEAERKLSAAANDPRLAEKDGQLNALTARVRQLENDNGRYQQTILRLERQVNHDSRLVAMLSSPSVQLVRLRGSEAAGRAVGTAYVVQGEMMVFYASNLPALPPGRTYQLWLIRERQPAIASGGTFKTAGPLEVQDRSLLSSLRGLAVTEEPAGGSPGPTGHKILVGTIKAI